MNFKDLKTKKDRTSFIREKLATDRGWAIRGLVRIFENQTEDEKSSQSTLIDNGIGFNGADAEILSSIATQYLHGTNLSAKQMEIVYKRLPKYAKQLERIAS